MPSRSINGANLHFADQGQGPVILFVHGFPLDHRMWHHQLEDLSRDHRVIAIDVRGFGQSDGAVECTTMDQIADDAAALLADLGIADPITFCGLSMGGYVAWQFFRRHRSRLGKLVLCDTRAIADPPEVAQGRLDSAQRVMAEGVEFLVDGMIDKLFAPTTIENRTTLVEQCRNVMRSASPQAVAGVLRGMADRDDFTSLLPSVDVPTLVICGRHDAISTLDEMQGIADQIPLAKFVEVSAAGHMAPLENPSVVNRAIRNFTAAE